MRINFALVLLSLFTTVAFAQPRKQAPKAPPNMAMMERLNRMSPEQRERMLEKLPPERQARLKQRLDRFEQMPPELKRRLRRDYEQFQQLTPENQERIRKSYAALNQFPEERRVAVRRELMRLRRMESSKREARLGSDDYRNSYSAEERDVLETISDLLPAPSPTTP